MTDISIALWVLSNCFRRGGGGGALGRQAAASFAALAWLVAINLHSLRHVVCLAAVKRSGVILRRMIVFVARQSAAAARRTYEWMQVEADCRCTPVVACTLLQLDRRGAIARAHYM